MRNYQFKTVSRGITPTGGFLRGFAFSLNPYIGCAFGDHGGCPFCYVRALPVARTEKGEWGSWVVAKVNLPDILRRELQSLAVAGKLERAAIFMSSATDPYQGIERRLCLTRQVLFVLTEMAPHRLLLQTRSPLITRDVSVLRELGNHVVASITVETDDEQVRRAFTPTSPSIPRRLACAAHLREQGIFTQLAIAPMLPNNPRHFAEVADSVADRVIVDTYFAGDGSGGRRSRSLGMQQRYEALGYGDWFHPGKERELLESMRSRLGSHRVLFSRDGFNAV